jgi:hypothetical protein
MSELIDNRAHRLRTLKDVVRHLHEGHAPAEVKSRLEGLVRECDVSEIAAMEQELIADGVPAQQIMLMCDLHAQAVRDLLVEQPLPPPPPGHPVDTFRRENAALVEQARALRAALAEPVPTQQAADEAGLLKCRSLYNGLMDVEKHYQRKEHLLFSCLERHGITGPSKVMWAKDDEVRGLLKGLGRALTEAGAAAAERQPALAALAEPALRAVEEMVFKEERILLPMSLQQLTATEWAEVWSQSPQFGYCLVDPLEGYEPPSATDPVPAAAAVEAQRSGVTFAPGPFAAGSRAVPLPVAGGAAARPRDAGDGMPASLASGALVFPTGSLTLAQLKAVFGILPVDITFVDADDRVRFFSEGKNRVFARPKVIIGRLVQHCHPPSSVDVVDRILADFRSGRQNVAEFWIELHGRFVQIRYFAVRDEQGAYLGTLEVTQDLTHERQLQGERRLLEYES